MPRKEMITEEMLLYAAFSLAREEGIRNVTARKLAKKTGCSTQPIFRIYKNMEELEDAVFKHTAEYFGDYCGNCPKGNETPFVDLAIAYISFARQEPNLFRMLFVEALPEGNNVYDLVNGGEKGLIRAQINKVQGLSANQAGALFSRIWVFIHGMACMALTGDFDLTREESVRMIECTYRSFQRDIQERGAAFYGK